MHFVTSELAQTGRPIVLWALTEHLVQVSKNMPQPASQPSSALSICQCTNACCVLTEQRNYTVLWATVFRIASGECAMIAL